MLTFSTVQPRSPVSQAFVWMAEYVDSGLTEFDLVDGHESEFSEIEQQRVVRFGLIGQGAKIWFERTTGAFNVVGQHVSFVFDDDRRPAALPGSTDLDLITFKRGEFDVKTRRSEVTGFFVGYKALTNVVGGAWFKAIVGLNAGEVPYIDTTLTFRDDVRGKLSMYVNFKEFASIDINAKANESNNVRFTLGR